MRQLHMAYLRGTAGLLAGLMMLGMAGCGGGTPVNSASRPGPMGGSPMGGAPMRSSNRMPGQGMSTQQKVLLLAGAAALYYLYNKHKNASGEGAQGKYYRSRNGQIYYRDAKGTPHWVTAPQQPIEVPASEYEQYTGQRVDENNGGVIRQAPPGWAMQGG
jgi:hypothetical protein